MNDQLSKPPSTAEHSSRPLRSRSLARVRRNWMGTWVGGVVLVAICLAFYLPGLFALPPIDRDEARFAEASRGIATATRIADVIVPEFDHRPRINKPPLAYWVQAPLALASGVTRTQPAEIPPAGRLAAPIAADEPALYRDACKALGWRALLQPPLALGGIWAYRLAAVLGALLSALLTWRLGLSMFAPAAAWWGGLLLGTCVLVTFDAHQARADQLLLAATVLTQTALWHVWRRRHTPRASTGWLVAFWVGMLLGVLAKGPITPALAVFTIVALAVLTRELRWVWRLRPVLGALVLTLGVGWWVAAVANEVGWTRLSLFIAQETVLRSVTAFESHWAPPGYHALLASILFWPGSLGLWPGLWRGFAVGLRSRAHAGWVNKLRRLRGGRDAELFLLCWLVPGWVVFELIQTKLPHYPLPVYPALALLCARGLLAGWRWWRPALQTRVGKALQTGWLVIGFMLCAVVPIVLAIIGKLVQFDIVWVALGAGVTLGIVLSVLIGRELRRGLNGMVPAARTAVLLGAVISLTLFQVLLPHLERLWIAPRVSAAVAAIDPEHERPLIDLGVRADSLVFLRAAHLQRFKEDDEPPLDELADNALVLLDDEPFNLPIGWRVLARLRGFEYSSGRWVEVHLVGRPGRGQAFVPRWIDARWEGGRPH